MPSSTTTGADATPNASAKNRDHNQGNQDRKYTVEQKSAVIRVRRCGSTAFYEILGLERTASDVEIKKAYRKLSLLTHPDKNGYDGADEAFKSELVWGIIYGLCSKDANRPPVSYSGLEGFPSLIRCGQKGQVRSLRRRSRQQIRPGACGRFLLFQ
jgi:hypothetical protein